MKRKAHSSHTFPEIIYHRFKKNAQLIFLFFGLLTNTIVTALLILGGAAVVNSLTEINIYVAAFLVPSMSYYIYIFRASKGDILRRAFKLGVHFCCHIQM
jgi:urea-proton symporter